MFSDINDLLLNNIVQPEATLLIMAQPIVVSLTIVSVIPILSNLSLTISFLQKYKQGISEDICDKQFKAAAILS